MQYLCTSALLSSKYCWNANSKKLISCFCYVKYDDGQCDRFSIYDLYTSCKHDERFILLMQSINTSISTTHTVQYLRLQFHYCGLELHNISRGKSLWHDYKLCIIFGLELEKHWELKTKWNHFNNFFFHSSIFNSNNFSRLIVSITTWHASSPGWMQYLCLYTFIMHLYTFYNGELCWLIFSFYISWFNFQYQ